jgi:hypothetical protein
MLTCQLQKVKKRPKRFPFDGSNVMTQTKHRLIFFAPAMRTGDYKYFARHCRALSRESGKIFHRLNAVEKSCDLFSQPDI